MKALTHKQVDKEVDQILEDMEKVGEQGAEGRKVVDKLKEIKSKRQGAEAK